MKEYPVTCFCGAPAKLQPNVILYGGKIYGNGMAYVCTNFPTCRGSVGVHPGGKPLGTIPDEQTKAMRRKLHAIVDPLWQTQERHKKRARGSVYGYLRRIMNMTAEECHIGNFDAQTCLRAMKAMRNNPYRQTLTEDTKKEFNCGVCGHDSVRVYVSVAKCWVCRTNYHPKNVNFTGVETQEEFEQSCV